MKTTKPVESESGVNAEWMSVNDAVKRFGISRSGIYALITDRAIRSVNLRRVGKVIGKRLIHVQSVRDYLERLEKEQEGLPVE